MKEVVYAVRAISPLLIALVLLVVVVLRQPLPSKGFTDVEEEDADSSAKGGAMAGATTGSGGKDAADAGATEQAAARDDTAKLGAQPFCGGNDATDDLEQGGTDQVRVVVLFCVGGLGWGCGIETGLGLQVSCRWTLSRRFAMTLLVSKELTGQAPPSTRPVAT